MRLPTTAPLRMLAGTAMALTVSAALAIPAAADSRGTAIGALTFLSDTQTPGTEAATSSSTKSRRSHTPAA